MPETQEPERVLLSVLLLGALQAAPPGPIARVEPPRLVVSVAIDQLRPDYLERWRGRFRGGLALLLREGVFYVNGEQDHAMTETAPGHSTMLSGRSPASTGILSNDLGVPDRLAPLLGSTATGASPRRFRGTTLADWMVAADPGTRIVSVSRKDRGAILPIGRMRVPIYWYSQGRFTTSRYYADSLPAWLQGWNARNPVRELAGRAWALSRPAAEYTEVDARSFEYGGTRNIFPHVLTTDTSRVASDIIAHTLMDSLTLDVAWHAFKANGLGRRRGADLIAISLSATDDIGHRYGPSSREVHDHLLNVDRWLGMFLDSVMTVVPSAQVVISLTADHGVTEFPEAGDGGRTSISSEVRALNAWALERYRLALEARVHSGLLLAPLGQLADRGVDVDSLANAIATRVRRLPGVRQVYTRRTLGAARAADAEAGRWKRQIPADTEWLVAVALEPGWVWGSNTAETSHGTTNVDDRRVPVIFRVPGVAPARITRVVRTIDIGPTHAALLNVRPTERVEGAVLPDVVPRRTSR